MGQLQRKIQMLGISWMRIYEYEYDRDSKRKPWHVLKIISPGWEAFSYLTSGLYTRNKYHNTRS